MIIALAPFGNCGYREGPQACILIGDREKTVKCESGDFCFPSLKGVLHPAYGAGTWVQTGENKGYPGDSVTLGSGCKRQAVHQATLSVAGLERTSEEGMGADRHAE